MGIDAEILVKVRGPKPTDKQIARWSWDLAQAVGPRHFMLSDGLPPAEAGRAKKRWHAAFDAHPLHESGNFREDKELHGRILGDLGPCPEARRRAIELSGEREIEYTAQYGAEEGEETHEPGKAYEQDGPTVLADPGVWFLRLNLWGRYYGEGYERGDLLTYCAMAEWIEANIPNAEVWYGGDSSGVLLEPFDEPARAKLRRHLYSSHGRDYYAAMSFQRPGTFPTPKPCSLCVPGELRFVQHGTGANYIAVSCGGCGKSFESRDGGKSWQEEKDSV